MKNAATKSILDCWAPPANSGDPELDSNNVPVAFISTTFTFDAEFFDEECLTRFLEMETEKENDGIAFLIEREEKLAGLHGGIVMVDHMNCRGERSLRWDLVPCRVKKGIMHSKITILHWSNCIRLIIGSANLTKNGCCLNQEVFSVIDYTPDGEGNLLLITGAISQLKMIVDEQCGDIVKGRFAKLQKEIKDTLRKWNISEHDYKKDEVAIHFLPISPKQNDGLESLKRLFSSYSSSPPDNVCITSPFFDKEAYPYSPSTGILAILRKKGEAQIIYNVTTEKESETTQNLIVNAPEFLKNIPRAGVTVTFEKITEVGFNENNKQVPRPLHQKSIQLYNEDVHLYMIGSSNFTSAALGLGNYINYEANLVYIVSKSRNKKAFSLLSDIYIKTTPLDESLLLFRYRQNEDEETEANEFELLPGCFGEAVIKKVEDQYLLELSFNSDKIPKGFQIHPNIKEADGTMRQVFNEELWTRSEKKLKIELEWKELKMPDFLLVSWEESDGFAFWPVIVETQVTLPPVDCLRDLPLEALLQILSSNQPLHRLLKKIERLKRAGVTEHGEVVDPHKLVNVTGFLLQRTRRVAYGMRALRQRLEKPVYTKESLLWRLYGPIGVNALVEAIKKEARSNDEKQFILAELALELSRVYPKTTEFSLKAKEVKLALKLVLDNFAKDFNTYNSTGNSAILKYSEKAFQKAAHAL